MPSTKLEETKLQLQQLKDKIYQQQRTMLAAPKVFLRSAVLTARRACGRS